MIRNMVIAIGIIIVAFLAINDTLKKIDSVAAITPAQQQMRTPARQNPGQLQQDAHTIKQRNQQSNPAWSKNPNDRSNKLDNFNRNKDRDNMRQYFNETDNRNTSGN